jgi:hypothetical protein
LGVAFHGGIVTYTFDSRMMEKEDAEQTSEEERKNLDEEKQRTAGEKLNEELIDLTLKLQDIGKQRKVANILNEESYQKLKQIGDQLFQVELDITERIGKPEPVGRVDGVKELLVAEEGQMEIFNDISRSRKEIEEESLETEKLFINKHKEILVEVQERIDGVEKEERDIQEKWKEASKDIEESKKPIAESGAEDQQKEKLQTKLEKLTAQKNAIEQKKQALLIERLTIEISL